MTDEAYAKLIKALNDAGFDARGADPLVPYEKLLTREDILFADELHINLVAE